MKKNWKVRVTKNDCKYVVFTSNGKPWRGTKEEAEAIVRELMQDPAHKPKVHGKGIFGGTSQTRFTVSTETKPGWKTLPSGRKRRAYIPTGRYQVDEILYI